MTELAYTFDTCPFCDCSRAVAKGSDLRKLREGAGVSLRKLAEQIGCSHVNLLHVEQGKQTHSQKVLRGYLALTDGEITTHLDAEETS